MFFFMFYFFTTLLILNIDDILYADVNGGTILYLQEKNIGKTDARPKQFTPQELFSSAKKSRVFPGGGLFCPIRRDSYCPFHPIFREHQDYYGLHPCSSGRDFFLDWRHNIGQGVCVQIQEISQPFSLA